MNGESFLRHAAPLQRSAALSAAVTSAVILFMDWVPTALNRNIHEVSFHDRLIGSGIHTCSGISAAVFCLSGRWWLIAAGATWYSIVLTSAALNWWVPYLVGVSAGEVDPSRFMQEYSRNVTVLPRVGDHVIVPDVQHMLIHASVLLSCILSWISFGAALRRRRPNLPRAKTGGLRRTLVRSAVA